MKQLLISLLLATLFGAGHVYATAQRGYTAWGGEIVFLAAIPVGLAYLSEQRWKRAESRKAQKRTKSGAKTAA